MTFEYDIYLPTVSEAGKSFENIDLTHLRSSIIEFFGGLTDTRHKNTGFWKAGGITIRDEIVIWRIVSDRGQDGDQFLKTLQKQLEAALDQDKILIVKRSVAFL